MVINISTFELLGLTYISQNKLHLIMHDFLSNKQKTISTERLILNPLQKSHLKELLKIHNSKKNMEHISNGKCIWTLSELEEKYSKVLSEHGIIFSVIAKSNQQIIGEAGYFNSFKSNKKMELGYILDSNYWKKGYGFEICEKLIDYGFKHLEIKELIARMYAENIGSVKLSEKCGMKRIEEGTAANNKRFFTYWKKINKNIITM